MMSMVSGWSSSRPIPADGLIFFVRADAAAGGDDHREHRRADLAADEPHAVRDRGGAAVLGGGAVVGRLGGQAADEALLSGGARHEHRQRCWHRRRATGRDGRSAKAAPRPPPGGCAIASAWRSPGSWGCCSARWRSRSSSTSWSRGSGTSAPTCSSPTRRSAPHERRHRRVPRPMIGTLLVTAMAMSIALPVGIGVAVWLSEYGRPAALARVGRVVGRDDRRHAVDRAGAVRGADLRGPGARVPQPRPRAAWSTVGRSSPPRPCCRWSRCRWWSPTSARDCRRSPTTCARPPTRSARRRSPPPAGCCCPPPGRRSSPAPCSASGA